MMQFTPTGGDDTAALQAAVACATSLEIMAGTSLITAPLVVDHACEIIWRKGARLLVDHPSCDVLSIQSYGVDLIGAHIDAAQPRTGGAYVNYDGMADCRLEELEFRNYHTAVKITNGVSITLDGGKFWNGVAGQGAAIEVDGAFDLSVSDVLANADPGSYPAAWLKVLACGDITVSRVNIMHHGICVHAAPPVGKAVTSLWVVDSHLDTSTRGVWLNPQGGQVVRSKFSDVWMSGHSAQGFFAYPQGGGIDGVDIEHPHCHLNGSNGAQVEAGAKNVRISGGAFAQNGVSGIAFGPNVQDFSVRGVRSGDTDGLAGNAAYGLMIFPPGQNNYQVFGNNFRGNVAGKIFGHTASATKISTGNL
jgi:hypothetical protein